MMNSEKQEKGQEQGGAVEEWSGCAPARDCRHALCSPKPPLVIHPPVHALV
jgi:hypothetical protein